MSAIKLSTPSSGSISLSPANTASNLTITVPAVSGTMATLTTPSFATTIGVGGATAAASGAGITFPATQSASSDANTLDDYEEGTWAPIFLGSGGNPTCTYGEQAGKYTKIGNVVYFSARLVTASTSGGSGDLSVSLPFASVNFSTGIGGGVFVNFGYNFTSVVANGYVVSGSAAFLLKPNTELATVQVSNLGGASYLNASGFYYTN
jgi:hypothetical protein